MKKDLADTYTQAGTRARARTRTQDEGGKWKRGEKESKHAFQDPINL